jgi:CheY-like chemotaxis protein
VASQKILVIDDSRIIRMRVQEMLPQGNFEVLEAKDGVEGLKLMQEQRPNLIMLDFLMPKMNGWELYQHMQADPALQAIPLLIMSGRKEEVTEKLPEPFEFFEFVEKPFDKDQLMVAIKSAVTKSRKRPAVVAPAAAVATGGGGADVAALTKKVAALEAEVAGLKKQLGQVFAYVKQKVG